MTSEIIFPRDSENYSWLTNEIWTGSILIFSYSTEIPAHW